MRPHTRLALLSTLVTSLCSAAELDTLKQQYLACARDAAERRLTHEESATCSQTSERLVQQGFGGDLGRLLAWWRASRTPQSFEQAQEHYDAGRYAQAYAGFAGLADCGHREAARIALQMRQFGPRLYGTSFMAGPQQLQRWRHTLARPEASDLSQACAGADPKAARKASEPGRQSAPPAPPAEPHSEHWRHQGVG